MHVSPVGPTVWLISEMWKKETEGAGGAGCGNQVAGIVSLLDFFFFFPTNLLVKSPLKIFRKDRL